LITFNELFKRIEQESLIGKTTVLIKSPIALSYFLAVLLVVAGIFFHDGIQLADLY
jgi:hypothetical protein